MRRADVNDKKKRKKRKNKEKSFAPNLFLVLGSAIRSNIARFVQPNGEYRTQFPHRFEMDVCCYVMWVMGRQHTIHSMLEDEQNKYLLTKLLQLISILDLSTTQQTVKGKRCLANGPDHVSCWHTGELFEHFGCVADQLIKPSENGTCEEICILLVHIILLRLSLLSNWDNRYWAIGCSGWCWWWWWPTSIDNK